MAKIVIEDGPDGIKNHLPPGLIQDATTMCGIFAPEAKDGTFTRAEGKLTCQCCIDIAKEVYESVTKRELKAL